MKCVIVTIAYNAEKTIERAIKSILAQTYTDWIYYIVDNGSSDSTYHISCRYGEKYKNIFVLREEINNIWAVVKYMKRALLEQPEADAMCMLDADDAYAEDFLKSAVFAMKTRKVDMVVLGTQFLDANTGKLIGGNIIQHDIEISKQNIDQYFTSIHWYLRQMWCKLYRMSVLRQYEITAMEQLVYGGDTALVLQFLNHADTFAIIAQCGYYYYLSPKSSSYLFSAGRYLSDQILYENTMDFIKKKAGYVSQRNREFMLAVYYHSVIDTLKVAMQAEASTDQKLREVYFSLHHSITKELFSSDSVFIEPDGWKQTMKKEIVQWILKDAPIYSAENIEIIGDILMEINETFLQMIPRIHLQWFIVKEPKIVESIALARYREAFEHLWEKLEKDAIPYCECSLALGQVLAAYLSFENEYMLFSKMLIQWYFENQQTNRACQELSDWLLILPNDEDLLEMKEKYLFTE